MELGGGASFNLGSGFVSNLSYTDPDMDDDDELGVCSDSSSVGSRSESSDEDEHESSYRKPSDTADASEKVLPVRRGISKFFSGKSKSFTSLADAASSTSVKEFAKPENVYPKRENNLLARRIPVSNQVNLSRGNSGGQFKKFTPSTYGNRNSLEESCSSSASPPFCLPPLHPQRKIVQKTVSPVSPPQQKCSQWRSFSVSDLQSMVHNA